jgi:hypothetical protein
LGWKCDGQIIFLPRSKRQQFAGKIRIERGAARVIQFSEKGLQYRFIRKIKSVESIWGDFLPSIPKQPTLFLKVKRW